MIDNNCLSVPDLRACVLRGAARIRVDADWHLASHRHPFHQLIVLERGALSVSIAERRYDVEPGQAIWYPTGEPHEEWCRSGDGLELVHCSFDWPACKGPGGDWLQRDLGGRIRAMVQWLVEETGLQHDDRQAWPTVVFRAMIAEFVRLDQAQSDPLVSRTRAYMRDHLAEPLRLDDLARQAHTSRYHFVRQYKKRCGQTPMSDLRRMRLHHARLLIMTSDAPLKAVAAASGLGDEYQLSRLFRTHFDATPGSYR